MPLEKNKVSPSSPTVLVVDDNKDMVDILTRLLSYHGMKVLSVNSGRECLEIVRSQVTVDVILLDIIMPEMDGLEVCQKIKQISPALPIILLTVNDDITTRTAALKLRATEFIVKPIDHADLLARLRTYLSVREKEREADHGFEAIDPAEPLTTKK